MASGGDFDRHLESGTILPVYALVGSERLLVAEAVGALRDRVLTQASDFNRDELTAGETPIERVIGAAGTLPMMAPRRWVHLRDLHALKAKDHPALLAYLERPAPQTVLVLSGDKLDQRTKLGHALARGGGLFVFEPPRQQDLPSFIERRARRAGFGIEPEAARLLADLTGAEVGTIDRSLEKLSLYAGGDAPITSEDVEATIAPTRVHRIFDLTDAIGARELGRASLLLRNALGGGESALGILAMIARQFRQLLQVKALAARHASPRDVAATVGVPPYLGADLVRQARRYDEAELQRALEAALSAEIRLKSSGVSAGVVLDRLLVDVIGDRRP